jgi:fucokinase
MSSSPPREWSAIAVTAPYQELADSVCRVLRPAAGGAVLLAVPDAGAKSKVGSGAATLNALLTVGEELSARAGYSTLNESVLHDARICVLHVGTAARGGSAHPCLPPALTALPTSRFADSSSSLQADSSSSPQCAAEWTLRSLTQLFASAPPGLVVASTDSLVLMPPSEGGRQWLPLDALGSSAGAIVAVPASLELACEHGVCVPSATASRAAASPPALHSIVYRGSPEALAPLVDSAGNVPLYTGLLWFRQAYAQRLLELHAKPPLDACTYLGVDSGAPPLTLALHDELLAPLCAGTTLDAYLAQPAAEPARSKAARRLLWSSLRPTEGASGLSLCVAPAGEYVYLREVATSSERVAAAVALREVKEKLSQQEPAFIRTQLQLLACGPRAQLDELLITLDALAASASPQLAARAFAAVADALALRAGTRGGLRSGPAANDEWRGAMRTLRSGEVAEAVAALAAVRARWTVLDEPRMLMRSARHYEGAVGECISCCVRTCVVKSEAAPPAPLGQWVVCETPARIDLAGGWSDTPPVCYECSNGGAVINVAISIDGRCPIGARARRIATPQLILRVDPSEPPITCTELADLMDHNSPLAPGALPKTVVLFCGLLSLETSPPLSLAEQLRESGGGVEIESWSRLPTGSGLGTSSILAAALVAAVGGVTGRHYAPDALVHAVSQVEQMLTTGGGWQDQAGGILPGVKICTSLPSLPLIVSSDVLPLPPATITTLDRHLQLVYTGKTRLARNLLQDVLRRWYSGNPHILANVAGLVGNAQALREALLRCDIPAIGRCLSAYWDQKCQMCDACPEAVARMLRKLEPLVYGAALAGAGGGGFLVMVTREPDAREAVARALSDEQVSMHDVAIHTEGLVTRRE